MSQRIGLLVLAAVLPWGAGGCFVDVDDDDDDVFLATYEPCVFTDQCLPQDVCLEITADYGPRVVTDAICTHECFDDFDCPISITGIRGACLDIGQGPFCYERCLDDFDCPSGFACVDAVGDFTFDSICLPF